MHITDQDSIISDVNCKKKNFLQLIQKDGFALAFDNTKVNFSDKSYFGVYKI